MGIDDGLIKQRIDCSGDFRRRFIKVMHVRPRPDTKLLPHITLVAGNPYELIKITTPNSLGTRRWLKQLPLMLALVGPP